MLEEGELLQPLLKLALLAFRASIISEIVGRNVRDVAVILQFVLKQELSEPRRVERTALLLILSFAGGTF